MTSLTAATLPRLNAGMSLPRYDRRQVTTGIVHIGVGNFHRAHQSMYIDALGPLLDHYAAPATAGRTPAGPERKSP